MRTHKLGELLNLPEGHAEQAPEPVPILYVPATHAVHVYVTMSLLEPAGQSNCGEEHRRRDRAQTQRQSARERANEIEREIERARKKESEGW